MITENNDISKKILQTGATLLLWLGSCILGIYAIISLLEFFGALVLMLPVWGLTDSSVNMNGMLRVSKWACPSVPRLVIRDL